MTLAAQLESLEGLDPLIQAEYTEDKEAGTFRLDVSSAGGWGLDRVDDLKKQLSTAETKHQKATDLLKSFDDLDPKKARDAIAKVAEMADWTPDDKVQEKLAADKKVLEDKFQSDIASTQAERDELLGQVKRQLIDGEGLKAIAAVKGNVALLLPAVQSRSRVEKDDQGNYVARVIDADGNARVTTEQGKTHKMTISELVGVVLRDDADYKVCYQGGGASGGGTETDTGRTPASNGSVSRRDMVAMGNNLEGIADGSVTVD